MIPDPAITDLSVAQRFQLMFLTMPLNIPDDELPTQQDEASEASLPLSFNFSPEFKVFWFDKSRWEPERYNNSNILACYEAYQTGQRDKEWELRPTGPEAIKRDEEAKKLLDLRNTQV